MSSLDPDVQEITADTKEPPQKKQATEAIEAAEAASLPAAVLTPLCFREDLCNFHFICRGDVRVGYSKLGLYQAEGGFFSELFRDPMACEIDVPDTGAQGIIIFLSCLQGASLGCTISKETADIIDAYHCAFKWGVTKIAQRLGKGLASHGLVTYEIIRVLRTACDIENYRIAITRFGTQPWGLSSTAKSYDVQMTLKDVLTVMVPNMQLACRAAIGAALDAAKIAIEESDAKAALAGSASRAIGERHIKVIRELDEAIIERIVMKAIPPRKSDIEDSDPAAEPSPPRVRPAAALEARGKRRRALEDLDAQ